MRLKYFFLILIASTLLTAQIKVGFSDLKGSAVNDPELNAAYKFLSGIKIFNPGLISKERMENSDFLSSNYKVIWIHRADSSAFSDEENNPKLISSLKQYLKNGGNLLLTLDAMRYLNVLGLETAEPSVKYADAVDDGYGRKLGLHSFRSHPIFRGLNGGAYIFNPEKDMKTRQIGYFGRSVPENGKVVAVDWAYITLNDQARLVLEYNVGKGKIIAVGAYAYFGIKNKSRDHLELLAANCIGYLAGRNRGEEIFYWDYKQAQIIKVENEFSGLKKSVRNKSKIWEEDPNSLKLVNEKGSSNFWNVAGERMLVMGKENAGIDEIWSHPFMALRDYEAGIISGDSVVWMKNYPAKIVVRPESFTRTYNFEGILLKETITASDARPIAVIHYELSGDEKLKLVIKFKSNLRFMWPYSEKTTNLIKYGWSGNLNGFVINDPYGKLCSVIGSSKKPEKYSIEHSDNFGSRLDIIKTDQPVVSAYSVFTLEKGENLDIVIAASNEGIEKTADQYNRALHDPEKIYRSAEAHSKKLLNSSLMITTPDKNFNEGYRWALNGTDKFFVNTPGLGKSLVAGYSTTAKGWDGGQKINGRPGYAWYFGRDGVWTSFALLDYGDYGKVKSVLEFMGKYQDLNGKIFHELTTSGAVHYDASDATPLYIILAGRYFRKSGDIKFLQDNWNHIRKAVDFCYSTDTDKDHLIENTNVGHGWVEGGGLYTAHTEVYLAACWSQALLESGTMAKALGLNNESGKYFSEAAAVKKIINDDFWNVGNDFLSFSKMKDGKYNSEKTVLAAVPVYFEMLDKEKSKKIVNAFAENYFSSDWGVRILREDSPIFNPRGYHTGSVWPLFTGWSALAEYKNGNGLQGFSHVMNNLLVYKNWQLGYVEEVLNGAEYKPAGVCSHQAWSESMVVQPAIEGMLGLETDALKNSLSLSPHFPEDWASVTVENIKIGRSSVNFKMIRSNGETKYYFTTGSDKPVNINFTPSFPQGTKINSGFKNGKQIKTDPAQPLFFPLNKKIEIKFLHSGGISVLPIVASPKPNDGSKGFRILSSELNENFYFVEVQGMSGTVNELKIYSPGKKIEIVENGNVISSEGPVYTAAVEFEKSRSKYLNKKIKIKFLF